MFWITYPPVTAPAPQGSIELTIGAETQIVFEFSWNTRTFKSDLPLLVTQERIGLGAFTIPALPISIVYAPPPNQKQTNTVSWSVSTTTGNASVVSFSEEDSTRRPVPGQFASLNEVANGISSASTAAAAIPGVGPAISAAMNKIADGLGSESATETSGVTVSREGTLTITLTGTDTVTTLPSSGGPGQGDVICFLLNAKICWFAYHKKFQLVLFGYDAIARVSAAQLLNQSAHLGLDAATVQALLDLDPFVAAGPMVELPSTRFKHLATYEIGGSETNLRQDYTVTQQDR